jgi:NADH-quinone oxidoreductase subunit A
VDGAAAGPGSLGAMGPLPPYAVVGLVVLAGVALFVAGTVGTRLLRPNAPTVAKLTTYESGVDPVGEGWAQINVRYYLYAYLYVVFAVDAMYLLPWATVLRLPGFGWRTLAEMGVFLGVLGVGLAYAWRRGVLRWL